MATRIRWTANVPGFAFGLIARADGRGEDILITVDYDIPGVAATFGWDAKSVGDGTCEHRYTDGTIPCPDCGLPASEFIAAAWRYLDAHDGATALDPGYF